MKVKDATAFALARMLQKAASHLKSAGYSHPPTTVPSHDVATFSMTTKRRKFIVTVRELSLDDELAEPRL